MLFSRKIPSRFRIQAVTVADRGNSFVHFSVIARSEVQMETGYKFLNCYLIRHWSPSQKKKSNKAGVKISQFTKFEVLLLNCKN